ncbi:hypothetical protein FDG2_0698 [Candidatus Protofrankia californiensis]|uniref:Cytochrome P450 n=1 Tax=Candidatus Protofrankia californiensis TaxID=1839754 RepID=A0A1C3NU36_9ACTN|nr:hypothetical protein FDG2_0698 [Candidatus Protofrankia californiensis]
MPQNVEFSLPWSLRINPHLDEARAHNLKWLARFGLLSPGEEAAAALLKWQPAELAAYFFPDADLDGLNLACDLNGWYGAFDDQFDGPLGRDPRKVADACAALIAEMHQPSENPAPIVAGFADIWRRWTDGMSAQWCARAAYNWSEYFAVFLTESQLRMGLWIAGGDDAYMRQRRRAISAGPLNDLAERVGGFEVASIAWYSLTLAEMREIAADVVTLANDTVSAEREEAIGEHANLLLTLERRDGLTRDGAIAEMQRRTSVLVARFLALEDQARTLSESLLAEQRYGVARYVTALQDWMRGNDHWSRTSSRYVLTQVVPVGADAAMTTTTTCPFSLPPGPSPSPEELWQLEQDPSLLERYGAIYGDLFTVQRPGRPPRVFLGSPHRIRNILLRRDQELVGMGTSIYRDLIGPRSMLKLAGAEHRRLRRIVMPRFAGPALARRGDDIHRIIADGLRGLRGQPPQPLATMTIGITARVMTSPLMFSQLADDVRQGIETAILGVFDALHEGRSAEEDLRHQFDTQYGSHRADLDRLLLDEIARARRAGEGQDDSLLAALLSAPESYSDDFIRDQIVSVLAGGITTAANGMSMALYWLYRRPDVAARVAAELAALPEDAGAMEVASLPYLSAVCLEALRVPTVTPTGDARRVDTPFTEDGYHFPEGTEVIVAIQLAHHDEGNFSDHNEFRPERFLDGVPDGMHYMPFGIGTHYCVGAQLAELEMKLTLAEALRLPDFKLLGADVELNPRSHGVNLTTPHSIQAFCGDSHDTADR